MISQANTMAAKMLEKIQETKLTAKEASEFLSPEPSDDSTTMTLEQLNEYGNRLRKCGGHRVAAEGTFYALKDTAESIQQMSMWIVESPRNRFFITSDKPLTLRSRLTGSRVGAGWKNSDAMGLIALSPRYFLILCYQKPHGIRITSATPEQVEGLNLETMLFASEEVYSPRKYQEAYEWMRQQKRWRR
jgi:hypothetical protein